MTCANNSRDPENCKIGMVMMVEEEGGTLALALTVKTKSINPCAVL